MELQQIDAYAAFLIQFRFVIQYNAYKHSFICEHSINCHSRIVQFDNVHILRITQSIDIYQLLMIHFKWVAEALFLCFESCECEYMFENVGK